jgi:hypothetical protein
MKIIKITALSLMLGLAIPTPAPALEPSQIARFAKSFGLIFRLIAGLRTFSARSEKGRANWKTVSLVADSLRCYPSKHKFPESDGSALDKTILATRLAGNAGGVIEPLINESKKNKKIKPLRGTKHFAAVCALLVELSADFIGNLDNMWATMWAPPLSITNRKEYEFAQIIRVLARAVHENILAGGDFKSISSLIANSSSAIQLVSHIAKAAPALSPTEELRAAFLSTAFDVASSAPFTERLDGCFKLIDQIFLKSKEQEAKEAAERRSFLAFLGNL